MNNKNELEKKLADIALSIKQNYHIIEPSGILVGASGISMFCYYYARYFNNDDYSQLGNEILENTFKNVEKGLNYSTYCLGLAGAGWSLELLKENGFIEMDTDEFLKDLDIAFSKIMLEDISVNNYDFLHGAIGYGFYFLKRYKKTKNNKLKKRYADFLATLILKLNEISTTIDDKILWSSTLKKDTGQIVYNHGLSHGISSIINFLSRINGFDIESKLTTYLLEGSVKYLLSTQNLDYKSDSLFNNWIGIDGETPKSNSRLAWCYGDLGIGISLRLAAISLKDGSLLGRSEKILEHTARRKNNPSTKVVDAGICHGSFGNAQIYNRLYQETKQKIYKETASIWIEDGLNKATFFDGYCGFKQYNGKLDSWESELNLLEGISGIGLAILSHLSGDNSWDECLMIGN